MNISFSFCDTLRIPTNLSWYLTYMCNVVCRYQQLYFPYLSGNGVAEAEVQNASIRIGFKIIRIPKGSAKALNGNVM